MKSGLLWLSARGALVQHPNYAPGQGQDACVYLVVQGDLNTTLARVEAAGGTVVVLKIPLGEMGPGHIAQFLDSEGNRVGLRAPE